MQKQTQVEKLKRDLEELQEELHTVKAAAVRLGTAIQLLSKSGNSPETRNLK